MKQRPSSSWTSGAVADLSIHNDVLKDATDEILPGGVSPRLPAETEKKAAIAYILLGSGDGFGETLGTCGGWSV